ncbi:MAG TPA: peptidase M23, partial [Armatimonadetes bacterium]|nr:peptidase M23 [Armatimonadota bacterium]
RLAALTNTQRSSGRYVPFAGRFIVPTSGRRSSGYGMRRHPVLGTTRLHAGIDIAAPTGTAIRASASGTVVTASSMRGYGNTVIIDHGGGFSTLYGHCSRLFVRAGQRVNQGDRIAAVGSTGLSTGPHLHFEIRVNGRPVNPASYL